jgi:hypothetical protein
VGDAQRKVTFAVFALIVLSCVFVHVIKMKDVAMAHEWLSALSSIFGGLVALCGIPYGISRAGSSINSLVESLRKRD